MPDSHSLPYRMLGAPAVAIHLALVASLAAAPAVMAESAVPPAPVLRAGAATSNITPPLGVPIVGNWESPPATHVHDELHARGLALEDGKTRLVLVVVDNISMDRELFDEAKRRASDATGVPVGHMMMSATHTHSSTRAEPGGEYAAFLVQRIADVVQRAVNNLEPARIGWGAGSVPQHVFNRRWFLKDGKTVINPFGGQDRAIMNPGSGRTDLAEPAGPTNPEVYILSVQSSAGRPIALLANYWLHYVGGVPRGHISADYFGAYCDRIQQLLGADRLDPPFVGILANGPCGDVNNINVSEPARRLAPYEQIRRVADDVAHEVLRVSRQIQYHDRVELRAAETELELTTRRPDPESAKTATQVLARLGAGTPPIHRHEKIYAERTLNALEWPEAIRIVLQAFRIGDLAVAAIPFETFTETGLAIKAASPFKDTFTIELANGAHGYLPTPGQHGLGGYETWLGTNRVEIQASQKIEAALGELFTQIR